MRFVFFMCTYVSRFHFYIILYLIKKYIGGIENKNISTKYQQEEKRRDIK